VPGPDPNGVYVISHDDGSFDVVTELWVPNKGGQFVSVRGRGGDSAQAGGVAGGPLVELFADSPERNMRLASPVQAFQDF